VEYKVNHLNRNNNDNARIKAYRDSLFDIELEKQINDGIIATYEEEKKVLEHNRTIPVNDRTIFMEDLEEIADFFRKRMSEINLKLMELKRTDKKLVERIDRISKELNANANPTYTPSGEVILDVISETDIKTTLKTKYFVSQAGWTPFYDLRVNDINEPLILDYRAKVWQNSGVDWKDVKVVLSTSNPIRNSNLPVMHPWKLYFNTNVYRSLNNYGYKLKAEEASRSKYQMDDGEMDEKDIATAADLTTMTASQTSYEFIINIKYTINSNNKKHDIHIKKEKINANYQYYVAPKMRQEAFLVARVSDWDKLNLLDGESNIYLDGVFKGASRINAKSIKDTLEFSLGIDESVVVNREKLDEFCETKTLGSNRKETIGYVIKLRNTKSSIVDVIVEDQVPISTNKDIEVELIEAEMAKHDEKRGILTWKLNLEPENTEQIQFKYSVKYPKENSINL
jgi:uncharacterized protein (TIGR02231 family)